MRKTLLFVTLSAIAAQVLPATARAEHDQAPVIPEKLDIATALKIAQEFNPALNRSRERVNELSGALMVTRSELMPSLDAYGNYQKEQQDRIGSFGGSSEPDDEIWNAGVELTQPLFAGGVSAAALKARRLSKEAAEYDVQTTDAAVMTDVYRKFLNALLAREVIGVQQESMELFQKQLSLAENRFEAGAGPKFDVLQARVRVANARPPLIRAQNDYRTAIDDLRTTMGAVYASNSGPSHITLEGEWNGSPPATTLEEALARALRERPEMAAAAKNRESAESWVHRYQRQHAPTLDFVANYGVENDRFAPGSQTLEGWTAGLAAKWQLFEGGRIRGEVVQAKSLLEQVRYQEDSLKLAIELEVRTAWNNAMEAREILSASEMVVTQAEEALRLAENRYSVGALTQLDVLTSQLEFTKSKLEKLTAEHNNSLALIELYRATGSTPGAELLNE